MNKTTKTLIAVVAVVAIVGGGLFFIPSLIEASKSPNLPDQKEYTVNTPEPRHVPTPSKVILDELVSGVRTIDFTQWKYGDAQVLLELSTVGNDNSVNAGQYKVTCDATITVPDYARAYKGLDGQVYIPKKQEKDTSLVASGWINENGRHELTKTTFRSYALFGGVPCEAVHFKINLASYYHGDVAVKATLLS